MKSKTEKPNSEKTGPEGWEVIYQYTGVEALADGALVDVTKTAKEAGIKYPTAVTRAVWEKYVRVPDGVQGQDEQGRLWDVLFMFRHAVKTRAGLDSMLHYNHFVRNDSTEAKEVTLKAVCGPGDDPNPVITIMTPDEDLEFCTYSTEYTRGKERDSLSFWDRICLRKTPSDSILYQAKRTRSWINLRHGSTIC